MVFIAVRGERLTTIQEISDAYSVSKNHLMKVVQQLGESDGSRSWAAVTAACGSMRTRWR